MLAVPAIFPVPDMKCNLLSDTGNKQGNDDDSRDAQLHVMLLHK